MDTDLERILTAILEFDFTDYEHVDLVNKGSLTGGVEDWVIDLAMDIADALEPGGVHTARIPQDDSAVASFVRGVQEARGTSWAADLPPDD